MIVLHDAQGFFDIQRRCSLSVVGGKFAPQATVEPLHLAGWDGRNFALITVELPGSHLGMEEGRQTRRPSDPKS